MLAKTICVLSLFVAEAATTDQQAKVKTELQVEGKSMVKLLQESSLDLDQFAFVENKARTHSKSKNRSKNRNKHHHARATNSGTLQTLSQHGTAATEGERDQFGRDKAGKFRDHDKFLEM